MLGNDLYEAIKDIATRFYIKCSKYKKEELTFELRETLFKEAYNEFCTMVSVNNTFAERVE
jgi:hypothetical protein